MPTTPRQFDVIVLGAGAAGLMCAAVAGRRGRRVALLEHNGQPGRKILISGGGRCNFTNLHCGPNNFFSENKHFCKSALALYQPRHFIELVERYSIPWHEKTLGQLFCDHSSRAIVEMLLAECEQGGVELVLNARGIAVESAGRFRVACSQGEFNADAVVVATGGLSIPKLGATGLGYDLARQFGLKVIPPRPALVPLTLGGDEANWTELAGVATMVEATAGGAKFREKMLVTHRGLSGPAILQASSYWWPGQTLELDFAPEIAAGEELLGALREPGARRDTVALRQALRAVLPQRLANYLAEAGAPNGWSNAALAACEQRLHRWPLHPAGTEGFEKAEVTAGGVDTRELQARTMEARAVPGLFFIGEAVDVTGQLGGFNFQWAWASGVAAGEGSVRRTGIRDQGTGNSNALLLGFILLASLMLARPLATSSQSTDTTSAKNATQARAALNAMVQALGGQPWLTMKNQLQQGKVAAFFHGQPSGGATEYWQCHAWLDRDRIDYSKHRDVVQFYLGRTGTEVTFTGRAPLPQEQVDDWLRRRDHSIETVVKTWLKDPKTILIYDGRRLAGIRLADQVTAISAENESVTIQMDVETHLPMRRTFEWRDPVYKDRNADAEEYDDYHLIDGIQTPFTVTRYKNGDMTRQYYLLHVAYNQPLDPDFWSVEAAERRIKK